MASVRKLPNGKWQAQFRPVPGGRQRTKTDARKAVVQRWLDEQTAAIVTGMYADPRAGRLTLQAFFDTWSTRQIWETTTTNAMTLAVSCCTFKDQPLRAITKAHIEEWVKSLATQDRGEDKPRGLAPSTIHTRFVNVRTVLRAALADRKIGTDPSLGVKLPKVRRKESAMCIPTADEVRLLIKNVAPEYGAMLQLAAFAGLRLGEASALKVGDIDFLKRSIGVHRQVQRPGGGAVEIREPKHGSERDVSAAEGLLQALAGHIALRGLQGQRDAWLFPAERSGPANKNTVGDVFRRAKRQAKISSDLTLHDLRHFYASGLIAAGCDVATVQHALGHSSPSITLNTYTHLWPKAEDRTRAAADGLVGQVFAATDERVTNVGPGSA